MKKILVDKTKVFITRSSLSLFHIIRNVVELGCGLGLLGLSICTSCKPRHYVFTDCHDTVLAKLNNNLSINGYRRNEDSICHCGMKDETALPKCPCINKSNELIGSYWSLEHAVKNNDYHDSCVPEYCGKELQCFYTMEQESVHNACHEYSNGPIDIHPVSGKAFDKNCIEKVRVKQQDYRNESRDIDKTSVASIRLDWEDVSMDGLEGLSCGVIVATGKLI